MLWGLFLVVIVVAGIAVLRSRKGTSTGRVDPPGVRTVAGFRGPAFVQADRAEDENPQFWGEALLKEVLARVGAPFAIGVLYSETCGHAATVEAHGHTFTVSVGFGCGSFATEWNRARSIT